MLNSINPSLCIWIICFATEFNIGMFYSHKIVRVDDNSKSASCQSGLLAGVDSIDLDLTLDLFNETTGDHLVLQAVNKNNSSLIGICSLSYVEILKCVSKVAGQCYCKSSKDKTYILTVKSQAKQELSETILNENSHSDLEIFQFPKIFGKELATLSVNDHTVSLSDCQINIESISEFYFEFCTYNLNSPHLVVSLGSWNITTSENCTKSKVNVPLGETAGQFKYQDKCKRSKTYICSLSISQVTTSHATPCKDCDTEGSTMTVIWFTLIALGLVVVSLVAYFLFKGLWVNMRASGSIEKSSVMDLSSFQAVRLAKSKSGIDIAVKE